MTGLEEVIGHCFRRPELLRAALTHRSYASEKKGSHCNERLEFLGDSILSAVVAHCLYERYPDEDEGALSKKKALLISRPALARWAQELGLGGHLYVGAGEEVSGGRRRPSILADAVEALIGAVYIDGGYEAARRLIEGRFVARESLLEERDHKSRLQEMLQKRHKAPPCYEVDRSSGPDHDKTFSVTVRMGRQALGSGAGKSKKDAEQAAAKDALGRMRPGA